MDTIDVSAALGRVDAEPGEARGISKMARSLIASEILKIANEVRELNARGEELVDLTVGDFRSQHFPVPESLSEGIKRALSAGHTHYPPSNGVRACREAVRDLFARRLGLSYPIESVLIAGGARPLIAATYLGLLDPGDRVLYGVPSWNNNHYATLVGAEPIEVTTTAASRFFPRAADLEPHIEHARLVCLCTPQNPTGTVMDADSLKWICRLIVAENERRRLRGRVPVYLMFDQVYWMLTFGDIEHETPVRLVPEIAPYTVFVDGISKGFAGTGLRVGWAVGPRDVIKRMSAILTHLGAWAPRPAQMATAEMLADDAAVDAYLARNTREAFARLELLSQGLSVLHAKGWDVEAIPPEGAIYLSLRVGIAGKKTADGRTLATDEDIRRFLLEEAKIALVPFQCFGVRGDSGWFRASVGAVSKADCESIGPRLERALAKLS